MSTGIYIIRNIYNNKCYIGQSINISRRLKQHLYNLKNNIHTNIDMQIDYNYHQNCFQYFTIYLCNKQSLDYAEKWFINKLQTNVFGYNKDTGGKKHNKKNKITKIKMSKNNGIKKLTDNDVQYIQYLLLTGTDINYICEYFEISKQTVYNIKNCKTYKRINI